jgi:hypothetical protein
MSDGDTERLRDRALEPAAMSPEEAATRGTSWTVRFGPGSVPEAVLNSGLELPSFAVADAATPLDVALASAALSELDEDGAVVVLDGDRVLGVWAGLDLATALMRGISRQATDAGLPGEISVPLIRKACRYGQNGVCCAQPLTFTEKPPVMPDCPNVRGLTPHPFGW